METENLDSSIPIDVKIICPDNTSVELSATLSTSGEFESPVIHSDQLSAASFRK